MSDEGLKMLGLLASVLAAGFGCRLVLLLWQRDRLSDEELRNSRKLSVYAIARASSVAIGCALLALTV